MKINRRFVDKAIASGNIVAVGVGIWSLIDTGFAVYTVVLMGINAYLGFCLFEDRSIFTLKKLNGVGR